MPTNEINRIHFLRLISKLIIAMDFVYLWTCSCSSPFIYFTSDPDSTSDGIIYANTDMTGRFFVNFCVTWVLQKLLWFHNTFTRVLLFFSVGILLLFLSCTRINQSMQGFPFRQKVSFARIVLLLHSYLCKVQKVHQSFLCETFLHGFNLHSLQIEESWIHVSLSPKLINNSTLGLWGVLLLENLSVQ